MIFSTPKTLVLLENIYLCILGESQCPGVSCSSNRIPSKNTWYISVGTHGTGVSCSSYRKISNILVLLENSHLCMPLEAYCTYVSYSLDSIGWSYYQEVMPCRFIPCSLCSVSNLVLLSPC